MDGIEVHWRDEGPAPALKTAPISLHSADHPPRPTPQVGHAPVPTVILLHGAGASLHTWDGWTERLRSEFRVIRLDLPGFGLTGPHPSGDYSPEATADFLERFIDAAGVERFALVGSSLGGYYAWRFALRHPDRVTALILIDAVGYPVDEANSSAVAMQMARMPVLSELIRFAPVRGVVRSSLLDAYGDDEKVTDALVNRYTELLLRPGNRAALGDRARANRRLSDWQRLPQLRTPTLVMWGGQDTWIRLSHAERFAGDIPGAQLVIYPRLGHLPMEEAPETSAQDALTFLRRHHP